MKTKKIVIGTMAAAMLSLSVCSLIPASAAGETVQITAGSTEAEAGGQFTVEVSLADIPATGLQGCNFSIEFDKSIITVDSIKAGPLTESGTNGSDPSSSLLPNFNSYTKNEEGYASIMWSTSLDDATYWLKGEGVLCTVSGTVAKDAKAGAKSEIKIVPAKRMTTSESDVANDKIDCGYLKNGEKVAYAVTAKAGSVTVKGEGTSTNPGSKTLKGDANEDGVITIADATCVLQSVGNPDKYGLTGQGLINGDIGDDGLSGADALQIQLFEAGIISSLD